MREVISGELVISGGDATKLLELIEEALDEVAFAVKSHRRWILRLALGGITAVMSRAAGGPYAGKTWSQRSRGGRVSTVNGRGCSADVAEWHGYRNCGGSHPSYTNKNLMRASSRKVQIGAYVGQVCNRLQLILRSPERRPDQNSMSKLRPVDSWHMANFRVKSRAAR